MDMQRVLVVQSELHMAYDIEVDEMDGQGGPR